jgi:hypothetical protein
MSLLKTKLTTPAGNADAGTPQPPPNEPSPNKMTGLNKPPSPMKKPISGFGWASTWTPPTLSSTKETSHSPF